MRAAVVGGGLAGLSAALELSNDFEVELFESRERLGGSLATVERDGYSVERFYHHAFKGDDALLGLMEELDVAEDLEWRVGRTSFYVDGVEHPLNTPLEILRYPHLSLTDKMRLALFVAKSRRVDHRRYDRVTARDVIVDEVGENVHRKFFRPLLRSKFGRNSTMVSGAWVLGRAGVRSHRSLRGEVLGYPRGGFRVLIDGLREALEARGCSVRTGSRVHRVRGGGTVDVATANREEEFDAAVLTPSPNVTEDLVEGFESDVEYQSVCCLLAATDEPILEDAYWMNLTGDHPFGAVVQHSNLVPPSDYGEHLVYAVSYHQSADEWEMTAPEDEVAGAFLDGLEAIGGPLDANWWTLSREPEAGPVYETGYRDKVIGKRLGAVLYAAGMFSVENYPERSVDGSVRAGRSAAESLRRDLLD